MLRNIIAYLCLLSGAFLFNIFYYRWFSWVVFLIIACIPVISLVTSLPFMIISAVKGVRVTGEQIRSVNSKFDLNLEAKKSGFSFFPLLRIKLVIKSSQAKSRRLVLSVCGAVNGDAAKVYLNLKHGKLTEHGASIRIKKRYCRAYDFLGLFFIPVKAEVSADCLVLPKSEKPLIIPTAEHMRIKTYKKSNAAPNDIYDVRKYRSGDELRNIHRKISAKFDELYVREPLSPVYYATVVKPLYSDNPVENDSITARLIYTAEYYIKRGLPLYADLRGYIFNIENKKALYIYLRSIFEKTTPPGNTAVEGEPSYYLIMPKGEEVRRI